MKLIESKTLGTAAASIEFTSIPQDATDLVLLISGRVATGGDDSTKITFNANASSYTSRWLTGNGSAASSGSEAGGVAGYANLVSSAATSNTFSNGTIYIPNYTGSTNKSYSGDAVGENNGTTAYQSIVAGLWSNTAAITSIKIEAYFGANLVAGSTISLYKITKGTDGIVTTSP
jgi:hypothetical protein